METSKAMKDKNLNIKSKGIYFILYTMLLNNEDINRDVLVEYSGLGKQTLGNCIRELKEKGYLEIIKTNINGKFVHEYKLK